MGFSNQEIQVTGADSDTFTTTDDPTAGWFFETLSGYGFENVYSDAVGTGGATNTITDTLVTPFGDFNTPATFASTAALPTAESSSRRVLLPPPTLQRLSVPLTSPGS